MKLRIGGIGALILTLAVVRPGAGRQLPQLQLRAQPGIARLIDSLRTEIPLRMKAKVVIGTIVADLTTGWPALSVAQ